MVRCDVLPRMTGWRRPGAQEQARTAHLPVIALTAHAIERRPERILRRRGATALTKPIDTRAFAGVVAKFLAAATSIPAKAKV